MAEIMEYMEKMEKITGKKFGDLDNPLLVSVRSGARASMPGMMDTILNLGLNEDVVNVIAEKSNNPRWAWDCYRRFIQMYSDVVMEVGKKYFEQLIDQMKEKKGVTLDVELTADDLKELAGQFKAEYKAKIGEDFPTDPKEQLMGADQGRLPQLGQPPRERLSPRQRYPLLLGHRRQRPDPWRSATWATTAAPALPSPATPPPARRSCIGEFLTNAQGEDVVAGVRTPMPISRDGREVPRGLQAVRGRLQDP